MNTQIRGRNLQIFILSLLCYVNAFCQDQHPDQRSYWIDNMLQISTPVLENIANNSLRDKMPVYKTNKEYQYLTAFGRVVDGIAPWLELGPNDSEEGILRAKTLKITLKAIENSFNPECKDYMLKARGDKRIVDLAYFAQGLLRAPNQIWGNLNAQTKKRIITELKSTRTIKIPENNFLLFASVIEAAILEFDGTCDNDRLLYGINRFMKDFYLGDSMYGDGATYSHNYYNSFVIHPLLTESIKVALKHSLYSDKEYQVQITRLKRFTEIQERLISSNGEFALTGRTLICRMGVFHALSQASYMGYLSSNLSPGQVRSALTAVLNANFGNPENFAKNGFLNVGFAGSQTDFAEHYISAGSAYHCMTFFTALGLKPTSPFWSQPNTEWTSLKAYSGKEFPADHSLGDLTGEQLLIKNLRSIYFNTGKTNFILFFAGLILLMALIFYGGFMLAKKKFRTQKK